MGRALRGNEIIVMEQLHSFNFFNRFLWRLRVDPSPIFFAPDFCSLCPQHVGTRNKRRQKGDKERRETERTKKRLDLTHCEGLL